VFIDNEKSISGSAPPITLVGPSLTTGQFDFTPKVIAGVARGSLVRERTGVGERSARHQRPIDPPP
jgi:hypothetical protein